MLGLKFDIFGTTKNVQGAEDGKQADSAEIWFHGKVCFVSGYSRIAIRWFQVYDCNGPVEQFTPEAKALLTGEIEAGKVGVAKEVKNCESNEFLNLSNDMLDMRSAIVVIIGLSTLRGNGRDMFAEKFLNGRNGYAVQGLAYNPLVSSKY